MRMRLERGHLCLPGIAASADVSLSCRILIVHAFGSPGVAGRDACAPVASPRRKLSTGMKGIKEIKKIPFIPFIPVKILSQKEKAVGGRPFLYPFIEVGVGYRGSRESFSARDPFSRTSIGDRTGSAGSFPIRLCVRPSIEAGRMPKSPTTACTAGPAGTLP